MDQRLDGLDDAIVELGEPPHRPVDETIRAGRRLVRRRRLIGGAVSATLLVTLAGTWVVLSPTGTPAQPAAPTSAARTATPDVAEPAITLTSNHRVVPSPGVRILRQVDAPLPASFTPWSTALVWTDGARSFRSIGTLAPDRTTFLITEPAGPESFEEWTGARVDTAAAPVRFAADGTLVPLAGVSVLEQTSAPELGPRFAGEGDRTGAAKVRYLGVDSYVVVRSPAGGPEECIVQAATRKHPTLSSFLTDARRRYADRVGLR